MIKKFFSTPADTVDPRYELCVEMREALYEYTNALNTYNSMRRDFDESSTVVAIAIATVDHYRIRYYELRLRFERDYGNADLYKESLSNLENWASTTGLHLLVRPVADPFLCNRIG